MTHDDGWRPKLVALDIDGTLLKWVEGVGTTYEQISPAVYAAVHRALDAGVHVVLASGRSPHGMTNVADLLDLHGDGERLWVVASNGAVVFRYPPLEVVHEVTFDAAPAVRGVLEEHPSALVAVEERGVGYRVNRPFPDGELSGEFTIADVADLVAVPVSRVIIRDPDATADDFVALGERLGLQGTDYVVGWTAWLDLAPVGVSKASGLEYVARELGIDAPDVLAIGDGRNDIEMLALGRPRGRHGPVDRRGQGGRGRGHRHGLRRGGRPGARPVLAGGMSLPRLVATDLDGTLLDDDGILSERTPDVLRRRAGARRARRHRHGPTPALDGRAVGAGRRRPRCRHRAPTARSPTTSAAARCSSSTASRPRSGCRWSRRSARAAPGTAIALECLGGFRHEPAYVDLHPTPPDMRRGRPGRDLGRAGREGARPAPHAGPRGLPGAGDRRRRRARDADLDHRPPDGDQRGRA